MSPPGGLDGDPHASPNLAKYDRHGLVSRIHQRRFFDRIAREVRTGLPETAGATLLDAGCGEGFVAEALSERLPGVAITGVDVSPEAIAYASQHGSGRVRYGTGSLEALPFDTASFDVVVCTEVLEHLPSPDRALAELRRVARRGVVVTVPFEPVFRTLLAMGMAMGWSPDPGHINFWTPAQWRRWLRSYDPTARTSTHSLYNVGVLSCGAAVRGAFDSDVRAVN